MSGADRIPTHLWVEAEIRRICALGLGVYVLSRGDKTGGIVLQKVSDLKGQCRLLIQQRDLETNLVWVNALAGDIVREAEADAYIARSIARDPDLWVVEIEDPAMQVALACF
jgi:hypothetical protein